MLLNRLNIAEHRGLKDLVLPDLAPINLIVGPNNVGKSSILEAISLLLRPHDPSAWIHAARQRDTDADLVDALWSLFLSKGVLRLDDGPQTSMKTRVLGAIANQERVFVAQATASEDWDSDFDGAAELTIRVKVDDGTTHKMVFRRRQTAQWGTAHNYRCFVVTPITHRSGRTLVEHLSRVIDEGQKQLALELIQLFDPDVNSLDVSAGQRRQSVVVQHKQRGVVDLASFGDGMRRAAVLALSVSRATGGMLLIDELETGIHPAALRHVTQRLCEAAQLADVQIVATTHSLEAIDALLAATKDQADRVAAYHLFPSGRDERVRRYDHTKLARLRASGLDLR